MHLFVEINHVENPSMDYCVSAYLVYVLAAQAYSLVFFINGAQLLELQSFFIGSTAILWLQQDQQRTSA